MKNEANIRKIIRQEIKEINEELSINYDDAKFIRNLIRKEVAIIFHDIYRKRSVWKKG